MDTQRYGSKSLQSPAKLSLCDVVREMQDLQRSPADSEKLLASEYRRVEKSHYDPRAPRGTLPVPAQQALDAQVSEWMQVYVRQRFSQPIEARKPFALWRSLKDAEDLIRHKLLQQRVQEAHLQAAECEAAQAQDRVRSARAFRVLNTQRWRLAKRREDRRKKTEDTERLREQRDAKIRRRVQSQEEYAHWLQRKAAECKECVAVRRQRRALQQQFRAAAEQKAAERAQLSYRHWVTRKYEALRQQHSRPEKQSRVLMAYSANRRRASADSDRRELANAPMPDDSEGSDYYTD